MAELTGEEIAAVQQQSPAVDEFASASHQEAAVAFLNTDSTGDLIRSAAKEAGTGLWGMTIWVLRNPVVMVKIASDLRSENFAAVVADLVAAYQAANP